MLQTIRRRSLARLRKEVEPVEPACSAGSSTSWQGLVAPAQRPRRAARRDREPAGRADPASILETEILPARIDGYAPADLDALCAAGEVVWRGVEPLGDRDGRVALYLTDHLAAALSPARSPASCRRARAPSSAISESTARRSSPRSTRPAVRAIRARPSMRSGIWCGRGPSRTTRSTRCARSRVRQNGDRARWRRPAHVPEPPGRTAVSGRALVAAGRSHGGRCRPTPQWSTAMAQQLLSRYGVRDARGGGSGGIGRRLRRRLRRAQGARGRRPRAPRLLRRRSRRDAVRAAAGARTAALAARDARRAPKASSSPQPTRPIRTGHAEMAGLRNDEQTTGRGPTRTVGALVILVNGGLAAYVPRGGRQIVTWLARGRTGAIDDRSRARRNACGTRPRRRARRPAPQRDRRRAPSRRIR